MRRSRDHLKSMLLDLPLLVKSVSADLRIGFEMLTATGGISVEEVADKPCVVVAATT
jgi:hypothetical protein